MINNEYLVSKKQLRHMHATVYKMADGTEVLKSYDTIVAIRFPGGYLAFSTYWTSKDASTTTKRHITTWCGGSISAIRDDLKYHWYMSLNEIDSDYLRTIEMATGGHIG